jgi:hypothetical protein
MTVSVTSRAGVELAERASALRWSAGHSPAIAADATMTVAVANSAVTIAVRPRFIMLNMFAISSVATGCGATAASDVDRIDPSERRWKCRMAL